MSGLTLFQKLNLKDLALALDLHPHEVIRVLVADGSLPVDLRFERGDVERVRAAGGVQSWWASPPPEDEEALVAALGAQFLQRGATSEGQATRFDNLTRGLDEARQRAVRKAAQRLLKLGQLKTVTSPTGLRIYATEAGINHLTA